MNQYLKTIQDLLQQNSQLSKEDKQALLKTLTDANKQWDIVDFKLDRTEKVKRTTANLLEETIAELETKRKAIEAQNRELEIESSLEKVRTVAMGMRKRDDMLDICRIISGQLELLRIKEIRNVQTAIFYQEKGTYINYEYYRLHDKALVTEVDYTNDEISIEFAARMIKGTGEVFIRGLEGQQVKDWLNVQRTTNVFIDTNLENARSLTYYWFSLGPVAIGMSTYEPLSEEEITLFKRFRNVFDLAYRRYLDIEKAEAQAREAQIEAALEKIRSRSLAMHKSDELKDVVTVLFEKLRELGLDFDGTGIQLFIEGSKNSVLWIRGVILSAPVLVNHPYDEEAFVNSEILRDIWHAKEKAVPVFNKTYSFKEKNKLVEYTGKYNKGNEVPPEVVEAMMQATGYTATFIMEKNSGLWIDSWSGKQITVEEFNVSKRVAKVFEQAYVRFLDLQKAEAQAREARIEAALEKVRSRSLAMHRSDELQEVVHTVFEKLKELNVDFYTVIIIIFQEGSKDIIWWMENKVNQQYPKILVRYDDNPYLRDLFEAKESERELLSKCYFDEEKNALYHHLLQHTDLKHAAEKQKKFLYENQFATMSVAIAKNTGIHITSYSKKSFSTEENEILKRFAKVFEQAYIRFMDLQKAEAQAREAKIEAALEKVRSSSLAMHNTSELQEVIHVVHKELLNLNIAINGGSFIAINSDIETTLRCWGSGGTANTSEEVHLPLYEKPFCTNLINGIKNGPAFFTEEYTQKEKKEFFTFLFKYEPWSKLDAKQKKEILSSPGGYTRSCCVSQHTSIFIINHFGEKFSATDNDILQRFGKVFEQTYTRFLDLQKAEAQARESQIQLALERVRARTMAMQHSDELKDAAALLFQQVKSLGVPAYSCGYNIWEKDEKEFTSWMSTQDGSIINGVPNIPLTEDANFIRYVKSKQSGEPFFVLELRGERMQEHYQYLKTIPAFKSYFDYAVSVGFDLPETQIHHLANFSQGNLLFITLEPCPQFHDVFKRFAAVFEQTYTRFLDLQKAEAQARESQIQLALERVRARTMAMQRSDELREAVLVIYEQLQQLNFESRACNIIIIDKESSSAQYWVSGFSQEIFPESYTVPYLDHPYQDALLKPWKQGDKYVVYEYTGKMKQSFDEIFFTKTEFRNVPEDAKNVMIGLKSVTLSTAFISYGALQALGSEPLSEEKANILKRFAKVFEQTYTRFLDLQKAEAQAREAQIEAAMEKVRARAMAMQKPNELVEVAQLLRKEMGLLGVEELETSSIYIHDAATGKTECWYAIMKENEQEKKLVSDHMTIDLHETWVGKQMFEFYRSGEKLVSIPMKGVERKEWINYCADHSNVLVGFYGNDIPDRTYHLYKFSNGYMGAASPGNISAESWDLLKRATNVFSLAYTRFSDLQQAEAQAREAQIEAALERVRSRTLAMQRSDELAETASVLFKQLILLGIEPNRLYINIIKDETGDAEFWITDEDGSKISMAYTSNMNVNPSFKKMYAGWKMQNRSLVIDMHGKELEEYFEHLGSLNVPFKGGLSQKRRLQYIAYFNKGFIGMASPDEQPEETMQLLERFAAVFNLTFTRFNDLKIAEAHALQAELDLVEIKAAKKKAEDTLTELQATQKQLVQSEKMASLGELTAGIAHEIQNPLNFVNNFSDVSNELLEEMKAELEKGNTKEVIAIVGDVKQNLEKILHHGKRADAIVKGMLQHSRTSSSQKELTDINALCDEYLRLAYHGLRAKDKSFNAKFETDLDMSLGKINIVPQDIGRAVLNLITNAFYVVAEKKEQLPEGYEPTVTVTTKKEGDKVFVSVKDNGKGIPQKVLEKIFQPFFTTKPTGQGTGLGLSLAYDIVKAHGGEIKVETQEGEGSEFVIQLPVV